MSVARNAKIVAKRKSLKKSRRRKRTKRRLTISRESHLRKHHNHSASLRTKKKRTWIREPRQGAKSSKKMQTRILILHLALD